MVRSVVAGLLAAAAGIVPGAASAQDGSIRDLMRARMQARVEAQAGAQQRGERAQSPERSGDRGGWQRPERDGAAAPGAWHRDERPDRPDQDRRGQGRAGQDRDRADQRADVPAPTRDWNRDRPEAEPRPDRQRNWASDRGDVAGRPRREEQRFEDQRGEMSPGVPARRGADRDGRGDRPRGDGQGGWRDRDRPQDSGNRGDYARAPDRGAWDGRGSAGRNWNGRDRNDARDWRDRSDTIDRRDWSWRSGNAGGWGRQAQRGPDRDWDRRWDRGWRQDRRYDWSGYRNSNRAAYRLPRYYAPYGWNGGYRRFGIGARLSSLLFAQNYWIDDPFAYRLPEPYGPYRWVRYYNDAILVDVDTGEIVDAIYDLFW